MSDNKEYGDQEAPWVRREPVLGGFNDDDPLEEPERDTDFSSVYSELDEEEERDEFVEEAAQEEDLFATVTSEAEPETEEEPDTTDSWELEEEVEDNPWPEPGGQEQVDDEELDWADDEEPIAAAEPAPIIDTSAPFDEEEWEEEVEQEPTQPTWPLGMIVVAVIALVLLGAGGYGVMEQRSAMQEQIRQLQATLATSAAPEEVAASRDAVAAMEQRNGEMQSQIDSLSLENRQLRDTVTGLEAQLQAQQDAMAKAATKATAPPKPTATPKTAAAAKPTAAVPTATGSWFVNFGSYGQQSTAEGWTRRLQPASGDVVVTTGSKDGRTFYRVRVINLPDRDSAERIARQLEKDYQLDRLWVGQQ